MKEKYKDKTACSICGGMISKTEVIEFNEFVMCPDCYDIETIRCDCCGERIWRRDAEGNDYITLCADCYDHRYTNCEECGALIHNDNAYYEDDSDYPYCERCYTARQNYSIKPYNYKPEPIFYGDGLLYMGVELEIDKGGEISDNADTLINVVNSDSEHIYCKHDGSINDGFEMVSHPMTLDYHMNSMNWQELFERAVGMGYRSHQTNTCGLHIHVNRNAFGKTYEEQEEGISKVVYLVENYWNELVRFSRRTEINLNRWASRYGIMTTAKDTYKTAKDRRMGRYVAVNLENNNTIEFRMFRGTLFYPTFKATLQLVDELCNLAINHDDKYIESLSWSDFVASIDTDKKADLIDYLKTKRLYVNDSVNETEEM